MVCHPIGYYPSCSHCPFPSQWAAVTQASHMSFFLEHQQVDQTQSMVQGLHSNTSIIVQHAPPLMRVALCFLAE